MTGIDLNSLRERIDAIDSDMGRLFEERLEIAREIAEYKKEHNLPLRDAEREKKVLQKSTGRARNPLNKSALARLAAQIIELSCAAEEDVLVPEQGSAGVEILPQTADVVIGYQGVPGAYSNLALHSFFNERQFEERSYTLFSDVVKALERGELTYGVLPIENSSTGGINEVYDLLRHFDCYIVGEKCLKIEHNLLACPGSTLEQITEVYSHPQGFAQCAPFFRRQQQMKQIPYFNTAKAAEMVAAKQDKTLAAVASAQAAAIYGLEILAADIHANAKNYTRFIIVGKRAEQSPKADKITMVVALEHQSGSLYNLLGCFAKHGLNMLNIESRPMEETTWEYFFHIDFSGNLGQTEVQSALREIKANSTYCKILGNYTADIL